MTEDNQTVKCTGCGKQIDKRDAVYGDHSDTYSGTVWHCPDCAEACND